MNREQRRKLNLSIEESKVATDLINMAKIKKALNEYKPIAEGTKVKLDFKKISSHPDYPTSNERYRQWVENNKDKEFITVHDTNPAFSNTVFLKDETGTFVQSFKKY